MRVALTRPISSTNGRGDVSMHAMEKMLLRVDEAARALSVSRWTIYRWVECGRLRGTQLGKGSLRIFRESLTDLIQRNEIANRPNAVE